MTWTKDERHAVAASYLGWTLDAFDFFVLTFVLTDLSAQFQVPIPQIALALTYTLALRPVGAFIFGRLADRYGRKPIFAINIALYSLFGALTAFAPSLTAFYLIRSLFGVAMGGIWGVGASLAMETIAPAKRGIVSGLMQAGYPSGYLFAALAFGVLYPMWGWRGLFLIGPVPAVFLIFYIMAAVKESPGWSVAEAGAASTFRVLADHWRIALFGILLMTSFTFFSHGTQDIYPTFLRAQHHFDTATVSAIAITYNIGAILGGLVFGSISQKLGRRRAIISAALLAIPVTALWAFSTTALMLGIGAFVMQFFVQGAWGVVPAHLNELSPRAARGTFAGTVYQLGNLIASTNATLQPEIAEKMGGNYSVALASVAIGAALAISLVVWLGPEARDIAMSKRHT
ncbi:MAG TPA: MFS transporter [Rhizomicrobium sp.]|nr:MFS transporter [Rhizomicrobium sp.]HWC62551.1 MFS transporter [Rhizomicrobium sp.]